MNDTQVGVVATLLHAEVTVFGLENVEFVDRHRSGYLS